MTDRESFHQQLDLSSQLLNTFYDWRHKLLVRFAVLVSALLVAANYLYANDADWRLKLITFSAGATLCAATALMDRVNQRIIRLSYRRGSDVEERLFGPETGLFFELSRRSNEETLSYHLVLAAVYWASSAAFVAAGLYVIFTDH